MLFIVAYAAQVCARMKPEQLVRMCRTKCAQSHNRNNNTQASRYVSYERCVVNAKYLILWTDNNFQEFIVSTSKHGKMNLYIRTYIQVYMWYLYRYTCTHREMYTCIQKIKRISRKQLNVREFETKNTKSLIVDSNLNTYCMVNVFL